MGYSLVISTSIKQVKGLELTLRVAFVFGSCCCEPHHAVKGALHSRETDKLLGFENECTREIAGTLGVAKSTVWYILRNKRTHWWAPKHKKTCMSRVQQWWMIENPLHGTGKPFHNIQEKNNLQEADMSLSKSTVKRRLHQSNYRGFGANKARFCQKTSKKARPLLEKHSLEGWN